MEWHQLEGFYQTAKTGNFTKAAAINHVTQSAISQQIGKLEEELEVSLFERIGKRKLVLTEAGELLYRFAESVLAESDIFLDQLSELKGSHKGKLRIAAPFTSLNQLLPEKLEIYKKQFPWIEYTILDRSQRAALELVTEGDVDFGIMLESIVPTNMHKIRWNKVETVLIVKADHPLNDVPALSLDEIAKYPLILPIKRNEPCRRTEIERLFHNNNLDYHMVMESSSVELNVTYVELGLGISFATVVPTIPALNRPGSRFLSLSKFFEPEYLAVVFRKDKQLQKHQQVFLDVITSNFERID
ncbi:MAG: LysR family transcriptional regulator [Syntrophomonadaceae bacterium]